MSRLSMLYSDHSLLQWSASFACPTLVVTGHNGFQSPLLSALCLLNGWNSFDPDTMASLCEWHGAECHPRLRHSSTYSHPPPTRGDSYIPASSTSVSSQCRSQADTQVISSRSRYTFTPRPPIGLGAHRFQVSCACLTMLVHYCSSLSLSDHFQRVASYNHRRLRSSSSLLLICM